MLQANATTLRSRLSDLSAGCDHALPADCLASVNSFPGQLDGTLRRLRASRLRFSVMRLRLSCVTAGGPAVVEKLAAHMADPHVLVGLWHDRSIVGAFFGPRPVGSAGDRAQMRQIIERCRKAMIEIGAADLMPHAHLLVAHRWTDEVSDLPALVDALELAEEIAA